MRSAGRSAGGDQSLRRREAPGLAAAAPRAPPARGASWVRGGAGAAPLSGARLQGPSGRRGLEARSAPQRLVCPAPAAAMAALPPPDEQDFIQAYEEVREKYKGTAAALAHPRLPAADWPALTGPPARQSGL